MSPSTESKLRDVGLLLLRVGLGGMFVVMHGWPKISGGTHKWAELGAAMGNLGITFAPAFWGFMSAFSEFVGGVCIALGLFFRPVCVLLVINLIVAALAHYHGLPGMISYPIELGIVALGLLFIGPGNLALGRLLFGKQA
jgi:putative oxidoreductase